VNGSGLKWIKFDLVEILLERIKWIRVDLVVNNGLQWIKKDTSGKSGLR